MSSITKLHGTAVVIDATIKQLDDIKKGDKVLYHRGNLAYDRKKDSRVREIAHVVDSLREEGKIRLSMRRSVYSGQSDTGFDYFAIGV